MTFSQWISWVIKPILFLTALIPAASLIYGYLQGAIGPESLDIVTRTTGEWTIRFLLLTLLLTPVREIFHLKWLNKFRRMLGLFSFFYANLHLLTYLLLAHRTNLALVEQDLAERPFIALGMSAYLLMAPLALTSLNSIIEWMGKERWRKLQRTVYVVATLAVLHLLPNLSKDFLAPIAYLFILSLILLYRAWSKEKNLSQKTDKKNIGSNKATV